MNPTAPTQFIPRVVHSNKSDLADVSYHYHDRAQQGEQGQIVIKKKGTMYPGSFSVEKAYSLHHPGETGLSIRANKIASYAASLTFRDFKTLPEHSPPLSFRDLEKLFIKTALNSSDTAVQRHGHRWEVQKKIQLLEQSFKLSKGIISFYFSEIKNTTESCTDSALLKDKQILDSSIDNLEGEALIEAILRALICERHPYHARCITILRDFHTNREKWNGAALLDNTFFVAQEYGQLGLCIHTAFFHSNDLHPVFDWVLDIKKFGNIEDEAVERLEDSYTKTREELRASAPQDKESSCILS